MGALVGHMLPNIRISNIEYHHHSCIRSKIVFLIRKKIKVWLGGWMDGWPSCVPDKTFLPGL